MNKKVVVVGLLAVLLAPATNGFAGGGKVVKNLGKLNPAKLERMVRPQSAKNLVPHVPGVYIPAGTTIDALERKITTIAQNACIKLDEKRYT